MKLQNPPSNYRREWFKCTLEKFFDYFDKKTLERTFEKIWDVLQKQWNF